MLNWSRRRSLARGPALSQQPWRPGLRRTQPEEVGPAWRHLEPAHVVLRLFALVIVVIAILIAVRVRGI